MKAAHARLNEIKACMKAHLHTIHLYIIAFMLGNIHLISSIAYVIFLFAL